MPFTIDLSRAQVCRFSRESAKIKDMRIALLIISAIFVVHALPARAEAGGTAACDTADPKARTKIDYINERYDDFFRYQEAREKHEARLQMGVDEVKAAKEKRELEMKRAAAEYRRTKKDYAKEEALRIEWEKAQKERDKRIELARLCEVQQRRAAEELLKKGRKIPELKEFDLEHY